MTEMWKFSDNVYDCMSEIEESYKVHDLGHVRLVDVMPRAVPRGHTCDYAIVQAARVSYGDGTKKTSEDRGLIRHLMRHHHTSPFEMIETKWHIKLPIFVARQWIRHRTACLAADTMLHFDLPGGVERRGNQLYKLTVGEVFEKFQPTENTNRPNKQGDPLFRQKRVQNMMLRSMDEETGEVVHTNIVDIWESGSKPVYRVEMESGSWAKMSEDHLCLTPDGWKKLREISHPVPVNHGPLAFELEQNKNAEIMIIGPGRDTGVIPQFNPIDEATETWKPVMLWEDHYEVSDQGRVRRIVGGRGSRSFGRCKKLTPSLGHAKVSLNRPGQQSTRQVHQLVMEAFIGPCPVGQECTHGDGNGLNNRLENLQWSTPLQNAQDRVRDGATTRLMARPEKIVKIERLPDEMTYDLEVSGPHNFSANGLVVHNSVNEYSGRYSIMKEEFWRPTEVRKQDTKNKQGSVLYDDAELLSHFNNYLNDQERGFNAYTHLTEEGLARELARVGLTLNMYTEWYWKIDLHNLMHFLKLRLAKDAQKEIRDYAEVMFSIVEKICPLTMEAFRDYVLDAITITGPELRALNDPDGWDKHLSKSEKEELMPKWKFLYPSAAPADHPTARCPECRTVGTHKIACSRREDGQTRLSMKFIDAALADEPKGGEG